MNPREPVTRVARRSSVRADGGAFSQPPGTIDAMSELRVVVPDEIAERLASEAAERGTSAEDVAAEVLRTHVQVAG